MHVVEDLVVVGPGWGGEVDRLVGGAGEEFLEEEPAEVDGAGAGDGLQGCYLWVGLDGVEKLEEGRREVGGG